MEPCGTHQELSGAIPEHLKNGRESLGAPRKQLGNTQSIWDSADWYGIAENRKERHGAAGSDRQTPRRRWRVRGLPVPSLEGMTGSRVAELAKISNEYYFVKKHYKCITPCSYFDWIAYFEPRMRIRLDRSLTFEDVTLAYPTPSDAE